MRLFTTAVLALVPTLPLCAQSTSGVHRGLETITESDVRRRIGIIAHDSMGGRDTPSRGLDLTANYIASEFKRLGLKPGGDSGTFLQRYPLVRRKLDETSSVTLRSGEASATASFRSDAYFTGGDKPARPVSAPAVVVGGTLTPEVIAPLSLAGKTVIVVIDPANPGATQRALQPILQKEPAVIVLLTLRDSAAFARLAARQFRETISVDAPSHTGTAVVELREPVAAPVLAAAGIDLAQVRESSTPVVREVPSLVVTTEVRDQVGARTTAPNVVGILEGTDPTLKSEYIVFSAHMDHVGTNSAGAVNGDSIWNGADDDASGTAGVLELAEAYSQRGARPKRSLIFLTVSGEEHGLWGSEYFAEHSPVPVTQIVANLNMDMIGRNWKDTIVVIGKEHSDLGATLNKVNAAHPELGMNAIDDKWPEENFYFRSDHYNFARKGVPILFFFNGTHPDYHRPSDEVEKIDAEKEARIVRLVYLVGQEVGNAPDRPKWNPESYKKIVQPTVQ